MLLEIALAVFHPNIILKSRHSLYINYIDHTWTTNKTWNLKEITYQSNDLLILFQLFRVYLFMNVVIVCSNYYSASSDRVTKMMNCDLDMFLSLRCMMKKFPFKMLIFIITITTLPLSIMLKIVEGPAAINLVYGKPLINVYVNLEDCIWNVLVIITTVGYGDYTPTTNLGRILIIIIAFTGILLVSLVIISLQSQVSFDSVEVNTKSFVDRLISKNDLKESSSDYFKDTLHFLISKSKYFNSTSKMNSDDTLKLKKKLEASLINRIKRKNELKSKIRNFNRDFVPYEPTEKLNNKLKDLERKAKEMKAENTDIISKLEALIEKI